MLSAVIVDDEYLVIKTLKSIINWNELGFEVIGEAYNGEAALDLFKQKHVDILFTDIKMPVMDGIELIENVMKISNRTRIIVLSAYSDFNLVKKAFILGAYDYILKTEMEAIQITNICRKLKDEIQNIMVQDEKADYLRQELEKMEPDCLINIIEYLQIPQNEGLITNISQLRKLFEKYVWVIINFYQKLDYSTKIIDFINKFYCEIWNMNSIDEFNKWISEIIKFIALNILNENQIVNQAKNFIQNQYCNEELSLSYAADKLNVSNGYLGKLFYNVTKHHFTDYLNLVRIEKAKELIRSNADIKIYEVAQKVGYKNIESFSRIFKKVVGVNAKKYSNVFLAKDYSDTDAKSHLQSFPCCLYPNKPHASQQ